MARPRKKAGATPTESPATTKKRVRIEQKDVPRASLAKAMSVAQAVRDHGGSAKPLHVAAAMEIALGGLVFRDTSGAARAYGLTSGSYSAQVMALTELGWRATKQDSPEDARRAMIEAFLTPRVIGQFLRHFSDKAFPNRQVAFNVLETLDVPEGRRESTLSLIQEGADELGLLLLTGRQKHVDLAGGQAGVAVPDSPSESDEEGAGDEQTEPVPSPGRRTDPSEAGGTTVEGSERDAKALEDRKSKVFVGHGKNLKFLPAIEGILDFGGLESVLAKDEPTTSQPVPQKVMRAMRRCAAAILHVEDEKTLVDEKGERHRVLNENVLVEIGAAMALYGDRFILLVKDGVEPPSNLQGLFLVKYQGDDLGDEVLVQLMKAIRDLKNHKLPEEVASET